MIEMIPLNSENLAAAGYDEETKVLRIEFHSGDIYEYDDVEPSVLMGLKGSVSPNSYFRNYIRGKYRYYRA